MRNTGPVKFDTGQTLFLRLYKRDTEFFFILQNGTKTFFKICCQILILKKQILFNLELLTNHDILSDDHNSNK